MGASHIEQIYPYVNSLNNFYNVYFLTQSGCFVTPSMKNPKWECSNLQDYSKLLDELKFDKIVTSLYSFDSYLPKDFEQRKVQIKRRVAEFDEYITKIKNESNDVYLLLGEPRGLEFDPTKAIRNNLASSISEASARREYDEHINALGLLRNIEGVQIIDPITHLCRDGNCFTRDNELGFFYRDKNHMRPSYAIKNLGYLAEIFTPELP